ARLLVLHTVGARPTGLDPQRVGAVVVDRGVGGEVAPTGAVLALHREAAAGLHPAGGAGQGDAAVLLLDRLGGEGRGGGGLRLRFRRGGVLLGARTRSEEHT